MSRLTPHLQTLSSCHIFIMLYVTSVTCCMLQMLHAPCYKCNMPRVTLVTQSNSTLQFVSSICGFALAYLRTSYRAPKALINLSTIKNVTFLFAVRKKKRYFANNLKRSLHAFMENLINHK